MTTVEPTRKPTAKELADQALAEIGELRAQFGTIVADLRERGVGDPIPPSGLDDKVQEIDKEFNEFVDVVNKQFAELGRQSGVVAFDPAPFDEKLHALEAKVAESFKAYSNIVDSHNQAATQAIEELRAQMPSLSDLASTIGELQYKVNLFDEAGVAPASAEDVASLDGRLRTLERGHVLSEGRRELGIPAEGATSTPRVYAQVHELMRLCSQLGKDAEADKKMGGYRFRSIDAAMDAVGHALREVGVMFQPREILEKRIERYETVSKDGYRQNWTHVWVTQRYAFVSLIDGSEMAAIEMDGEARDNGDKSTSKADSMRLKYALLQALMIPINGLPESDGRDGTEGGEVHGRGDGESWENATPARPDQRAGARGQGSQPPESPSSQAPAQAPEAPKDDTRTPEEKATAAYEALVALAGLEKPAQRPRLNKILTKINEDNIGSVLIQTVDGRQCTLGEYAGTVNAQVGV